MNFYYHTLTTTEISSSLKNKKLFLPVGTIEQHGPHLPLSVDIDIPEAITKFLAQKLSGLCAPSISYGARSLPQSGGGSDFLGTIFVKGDSLIGYYRDVIRSYFSNGVEELIIINGHYENEPFIFEALEQCRENKWLTGTVIALSWWSLVTEKLIVELFGNNFPGWHAEHAGLVETSLMMYLKPETVRQALVNHEKPPLAGVYLHPIDSQAISNQGVLAKTVGSSSEIGKILFNNICEQLINLILNPHGMKKVKKHG